MMFVSFNNNTTSYNSGTETSYHSGVPEFIPTFCGILVPLFSVLCSELSACIYSFWLTPLFVGFLLLSLVFCVVSCLPVFTAVG